MGLVNIPLGLSITQVTEVSGVICMVNFKWLVVWHGCDVIINVG